MDLARLTQLISISLSLRSYESHQVKLVEFFSFGFQNFKLNDFRIFGRAQCGQLLSDFKF